MKRFLSISLLMLCLSYPALGGHALEGGAYCNCYTAGCVEDYPGECGSGYLPMTTHQRAPIDPTAEIGIALVALLLWLKLKA